MMKQNLDNPAAVRQLVDAFYEEVRADALLAPLFAGVNWPEHLPRMYAFWEGLLLGTPGFQGNPMQTHLRLHQQTPFLDVHFQRWVGLFRGVVEARFCGEGALAALAHAQRIACAIQFRVKWGAGR
jgi:hemoglobin